MPQVIDGRLGKVSERIGDVVGGTLGVARHTVRRAEHAAEDMMYDASRKIRRHPFRAVVASFGVAFAAGLLVGRLASRKR